MDNIMPTYKIVFQSLMKFINSSKDDYITIDKIKQFRKDINTTYKNCLCFFGNIWTTYKSSYNGIYLYIKIGTVTYILKFDNALTFSFFAKEFELEEYYANYLLSCHNEIFNYDELEVEQDGYIYNTFIYNERPYGDKVVITIDKESRILLCGTDIDKPHNNTCITEFATKRLGIDNKNINMNININQLPKNIRMSIILLSTLILMRK